MFSFAIFAFWRQWFKIYFGLCIGTIRHTLWGKWWLVVCGNTPSEEVKGGWVRLLCLCATQWKHSAVPLRQEGLFAFLSRLKTMTAISNNFKRWKFSTLISLISMQLCQSITLIMKFRSYAFPKGNKICPVHLWAKICCAYSCANFLCWYFANDT